MPEYNWKALSADGRKLSGKSHAADLTALTNQLEQSGQMLLKATPVRMSLQFGSGKIGKLQLINFSFQLSMMLKAGVTILEALRDIADAEGNPALRQVIGGLGDSLSSCKTLSQSMSKYPKVFDEVYVNLIQAGEQTGQLTEVQGEVPDHGLDHSAVATDHIWAQHRVEFAHRRIQRRRAAAGQDRCAGRARKCRPCRNARSPWQAIGDDRLDCSVPGHAHHHGQPIGIPGLYNQL